MGVGIANIAYFIDIPSFVIVAFPTVAALFACRDRRSSRWLAFHCSWLAGLVGTVIGAILMLKSWNEMAPEFIGPGSAVMIMTLFYGFLGSLIILVCS